MFKITYFDHQCKKWVQLNNTFNLEEKKKIIEGFFLAYHKTVTETCTSINKRESYSKTKDGLDKVNVRANCTADIKILQTAFKKGLLFPPYLEDLDSLFERVGEAFDRVSEKKQEKVEANFEFLKTKKT